VTAYCAQVQCTIRWGGSGCLGPKQTTAYFEMYFIMFTLVSNVLDDQTATKATFVLGHGFDGGW
jgi:hypothetical protein